MGAEPGASRRGAAARVLVLAAAGVLGALAFPKAGWSPLAWIWLVPTLVSGAMRPRRAALLDGWLAGTVFYVVLLRWLDHTFLHYSAIPWPLTWLPIVALAAYCGLYLGVLAGAVAWLRGRLGGSRGDPAVDRADDQVGSSAPRADHGHLRAAHARSRAYPARRRALAGDRDDHLPARRPGPARAPARAVRGRRHPDPRGLD